jgi:hypothetical protein
LPRPAAAGQIGAGGAFINRALAKGWRRQVVDLLDHAWLVNAITLARCRARERVDDVA